MDAKKTCLAHGINLKDELENGPKCPKCGSDMKWWVTCYRCRNLKCRNEIQHKKRVEKVDANTMTAEELLKKLYRSITTIHLDMGGDHRYAMSHKTHKIISEIKAYLSSHEQQREYQKYEFCKAVNCRYHYSVACGQQGCLYTAKEFYHWLTENGFEITKSGNK